MEGKEDLPPVYCVEYNRTAIVKFDTIERMLGFLDFFYEKCQDLIDPEKGPILWVTSSIVRSFYDGVEKYVPIVSIVTDNEWAAWSVARILRDEFGIPWIKDEDRARGLAIMLRW